MASTELTPTDRPIVFPEVAEQQESICASLTHDPSLRYRLRSALNAFSIEPETPLGLGYSQRPFVDMNALCREFNLPIDPKTYQGSEFALTFLEGCLELRDDAATYYEQSGNKNERKLATFASLPAPLQILGAFKVICSLEPDGVFTDAAKRAALKAYFTDHLAVPETRAEDIVRGAAIVGADIILESLLYSADDGRLVASGVGLETLVGPTNPARGLHLGQDLETVAVKKIIGHMISVDAKTLLEYGSADKLPDYYSGWGREAYRHFEPRVRDSLGRAIDLSGKPVEERALWESYIFGKVAFAKGFEGRYAEGFDGGLDQLVSWREPVADGDYKSRMKMTKPWLEVAQRFELDPAGLDLAKQAFALETLQRLEIEVIHGADSKRKGRINTIGRLLSDMKNNSPELVAAVLAAHPLLKPAIVQAMDPWGYPYNQD